MIHLNIDANCNYLEINNKKIFVSCIKCLSFIYKDEILTLKNNFNNKILASSNIKDWKIEKGNTVYTPFVNIDTCINTIFNLLKDCCSNCLPICWNDLTILGFVSDFNNIEGYYLKDDAKELHELNSEGEIIQILTCDNNVVNYYHSKTGDRVFNGPHFFIDGDLLWDDLIMIEDRNWSPNSNFDLIVNINTVFFTNDQSSAVIQKTLNGTTWINVDTINYLEFSSNTHTINLDNNDDSFAVRVIVTNAEDNCTYVSKVLNYCETIESSIWGYVLNSWDFGVSLFISGNYNNDYIQNLQYSTDFGATWSNISGVLTESQMNGLDPIPFTYTGGFRTRLINISKTIGCIYYSDEVTFTE